MKRKVLTLYITLLSVFCAHAQMGKLFNTENQLSSNFANQVFQDHDGFIWIATRNGLNRYDGYQFHTFKKEDKESGIHSNYINCLTQGRNGTIYVGFNNGVQSYDGSHFHDFQLTDNKGKVVNTYINYLTETGDGSILACTSGYGVIRLNIEKHNGTTDKTISGGQNYIRFMMEDKQGRLWLITENNGLTLIQGKQRTQFFREDDYKSRLFEIKQDFTGNIWLVVCGKGLYRYNESSRSFSFIEQTAGLSVKALCTCRDGKLLLGCDGQGIILYNPKNGQLTNNPFYSRELLLSKSKASSILEDQNGNIWIGLLQKGIFMQPQAKMAFGYMGDRLGSHNIIGSNCVSSTLIDSQGRVWVGTDKDGLYQLDKTNITAIHHTQVPSTILSMAEDCKGHLWMASFGDGCGWLDPQTGEYHKLEALVERDANVFGIAAARNGDVWIATMGEGIVRLNVNDGSTTVYRMKKDADNNRKINSLPNDYICKICLSPDERLLFVASTIGLSCLDIQKNSWTNVLKGNCVNYGNFSRDVYADQQGKVWVGTNDGLFCYDLTSHQSRYYTTEDGLPNNGIASIISDKQGNLWLGTDQGLCCFNPKTGACTNYYVDNGLQGSEFSDGASCMSAMGSIMLGGTGGISWFNPAELKPQTWKAEVHVTGFIVRHIPVIAGTKSGIYTITDSTSINTDRYDLCADDNTFTIQLSTFTYDTPEHITYLYSINGEDWTRLQTGINEITFSQLPPGTYRFKVKAMSNQQETEIRQFIVKIHSPWYASTWAWLFYVLLALLAIYTALRSRQRQVSNQLRLQEHIHAEQMADAKLRFFMNISHEIRTPMTLIVTPLQSLIKQDNDPQRRGIYETIRRNAERILGLINQMMDLRKIDKGQMKMKMRETNLVEFVTDIYSLFTLQAKAKNVELTYEHDMERLPVWIDRGNFDKVVVNILSNAFKYTSPGGKIHIRVAQDDQHATLSVRDNGDGIPADQLDHIFERFYQLPTHTNDRNTGTGIGLDLTRSLVELHHGTIEAHNNADGKGCEFIVTIPLGNSHLQPDEIMDITEHEDTDEKAEIVPEEIPEDAVEPVQLPKSGKRQKIVVVEDDDEIRDYLSSQLSDDFEVITCNNGLKGLKEVLKAIPDLVISDIMMPEMDGNTLCSKIKSNPSTNHVPVILITAKNRDEDQLEGLETGADAYVVKPFNMEILKRTIINLIHTHQMLRLKYGRNDQLEEQVEDVQMKSPDDKLLERVMNVINKNLSNSDLSVDRIAEEVGISRVHLHRKMKELTGQTPHDFIRNIRLKQAAHLLANNNMNITEVMYACGFNNSASFSTIFKRFYGLSPRDYMREHDKNKK